MSDAEFDRAVELHRAGRLDEAEVVYQQILNKRPTHFDARHLMGVIASQRGDYDMAANLIELALELNDKQPGAFVNLGNALMGAGRAEEAEEAYRRALKLDRRIPEALFGLGNALRATKPNEATDAYRKAVQQRSNFVEAMANLAALLPRERAQEALDLWLKASKLRPASINLYIGAAKALAVLDRADEASAILNGLTQVPSATLDDLFDAGNALAEMRRYDDAAALYREILRRDPSLFAALNNLGNMLRELNRLDEAEAAYRRAMSEAPNDASIVSNHALILKDMGQLVQAEAECRRSLAIQETAVGHGNLGLILMGRGQVQGALDEFNAAEKLAPGDPDIVFSQGYAALYLGRLGEGWPKFEARWAMQRMRERRRDFMQPQWRGEAFDGKTILVHAEQGFGDTFQFVRYAPLLAERGARVILECQPAAARLMVGVEGISAVVPRGQPLPEFDLHCPLMSLPLAFDTTLETIPAEIPYIRAPEPTVAQWNDVIDGLARPRIGLVWAGDARHYDVECNATDRRRSLTLDAYGALLEIPGVNFLSLQVGPAAEQARAYSTLIDHTARIKDFSDTAGLITHLDLVISVDTAVAHLAAAMGKPVWLLSRFDNCWRWMGEREDSPWYLGMRLYRQTEPYTWGPILQRLATDLRRWVSDSNR
ncbi:MAG TPA: tetratricopeptide repeat protein [Magnetospirillaceae bacterium]|jgi:tetratricopeptide (TPR) repeat protein